MKKTLLLAFILISCGVGASPEITFTSCPNGEVVKDSFEIKYKINSGKHDIASFRYFVYKNGKFFTSAVLGKEYTDDIFNLPESNESLEFGYLIEKDLLIEENNWRLEVEVIDEESNSDYQVCKVTFLPNDT